MGVGDGGVSRVEVMVGGSGGQLIVPMKSMHTFTTVLSNSS